MEERQTEKFVEELIEAIRKNLNRKPQYCCEDWKQHVCFNRVIEILDLAQSFRYCPWCGEKK